MSRRSRRRLKRRSLVRDRKHRRLVKHQVIRMKRGL